MSLEHVASNIKYIGFTSKKRFGVEIELNRAVTQQRIRDAIYSVDSKRDIYVSGYSHTINNDYWHVKTDSTCGDLGYKKDSGGWEVASFVASGYRDLCCIGNVVDAIKVCGAQVNKNCGLHIHVDIHNIGELRLYQLIVDWLRIESIVYETVPSHRKSNIYCVPLRTKFKIPNNKVNIGLSAFQHKVISNTSHVNDRRVALNVCKYVHGYGEARTVELRLPESTLNYRTVKHWIRLFVHFVTVSCSNHATSLDVIDLTVADLAKTLNILGLHGDSDFCILSKHLRATKIWFLRRILNFSQDYSLKEQAHSMLMDII